VTVEAPGFQSQTREGLTLDVNQRSQLDFVLDVGSTSAQVQVSASAGELRPDDASVGTTVNSAEIAQLPVNGRNYTKLILLIPGASSVNGSQSDGTVQGTALYSVNGERDQDNYYTLDGIENNFFHKSSPGGSPPMDSVAEFRIETSGPAEFGRMTGANVALVTKSGTNELHGSLYEYLRNDDLDANNFFSNSSGLSRTPFHQNQFGAAIGGPVFFPKIYNGKNRTFWFASYEGLRSTQAANTISTVPTSAEVQGNFNGTGSLIYDPLTTTSDAKGDVIRQPFPNNTIPASRLDPGIQYALKTLVPLPNLPGIANNYLNTNPTTVSHDIGVVRLDQSIDSRNNIFVRALDEQVTQVAPGATPDFDSPSGFNELNIAIGWTSVLSPSSVLDVRLGYTGPSAPSFTRNTVGIDRSSFIANTGIELFQPVSAFNLLPSFTATGEFSFGESGGTSKDNVYQLDINYTRTVGKTTWKSGFTFSPRRYYHDSNTSTGGTATFTSALTQTYGVSNSGDSIASFLLGYPESVTRGVGDSALTAHQDYFGFYTQADWKLTPRITLNIGLRYEFFFPIYANNNNLGTLLVTRDPNTGAYDGTLLWAGTNPLTGQGPNQAGYGPALQVTDPWSFAPRAGLVARLNSHTILRSGFGIFYDTQFFQESQDKSGFYPYTNSQSFTANSTLPTLSLENPGPSYANTAAIGGYAQNPNNLNPYSEQWNLFLQRELPAGIQVQAGYVGMESHRLIGYDYFNTAVTPGPGAVQPRRLLPAYGDLEQGDNMFNANYNALQLQALKRYANGIEFNINYTWGHALDGQSSLAEIKTQNPFDRAADYSSSSFDVRQVFQAAFVYDVPYGRGRKFGAHIARPLDWIAGGWSLEGNLRFQTGAPINVVLGLDQANVGTSIQRPNVIGNPNNGPQTPQEWFNTSAFVLPAPFTYGDSGAFTVRADGRRTADVSVHKLFAIREHHTLDLRGEFFNLPNNVSFGNPNATFTSKSFGTITSTGTNARQIQMALRYAF
jgi:hypothetical protein